MVFVSVDDLIFLSKILDAARLLGVPVKSVPPSGLMQEIRQNPGCQLILDLNHRSGTALDLVRTLKNDPSTRGVPILGFVSHVQTELIGRARQAGCDKVVARSAFSEQLPRFLTELAGAGPAQPGE
jgi:CheY-like chemotaxis protein